MLAVIGLIAAILVTAATPSGAVLEAGIGSDSALSSARTAYSNVGEWLDTSDRQAVLDSYQAEFSKPDPDIGWTGNRASCQAGTTNPAYRSAIIDRVNWFRSIAGVPANSTENATYSAKAQQAALMMSVSDRLSHSPDSSFDCYTAIGSEAAGKSNLYLGRTGPHAITGYMFDPGSGNVSVGHRNWILHPSVRQFGTGDTPGPGRQATNTLWVIDNAFASQPVMRESDGFVAWPARGYVPGDLVFPRWSFSLRGADLDQASVAVQRTENGQVVENIVSPVVFGNDSRGAPFSIVVWEPVGIDTSPAVDETYRVTIGNVGVGSATRSFSYEVTIIGDRAASQRPLASSAEIAAFANAAFNDFVGRDATQAEKDLWVARILGGSSRNSLVADLAQSDEWAANVVDKMYQDTLGRNADPAGRAFWVDQLQHGTSVARMAALFYGSPEYIETQGNRIDRWITDLYGELLDREPDGSGRDFWISETGRTSPGSVALRFYQSDESRRARVQALYLRLLGRSTDRSGEDHWVAVLANGDDLTLAANLAASDEYFTNASR
jgi:hypothetical protein